MQEQIDLLKKETILHAQRLWAESWNCDVKLFSQKGNVFLKDTECFFEMVTFGNNAVMRLNECLYDWAKESFETELPEDIMDGENLYRIESKLREYGKALEGEHMRYLYLCPENELRPPNGFTFEIYEGEEMQQLYKLPDFDNALNYWLKGEVLAIVAKKEGEIAAMVAADTYVKGLWQIGIDTVAKFRRCGLASYLVKELAEEIVKRGGIPYYTTWAPNLASTNTALKAGFRPVWCGYSAGDVK